MNTYKQWVSFSYNLHVKIMVSLMGNLINEKIIVL
jgi:hypothetical protein